MDMQQIDLPDSSVDAVVSRFGYMLVPGSRSRSARDVAASFAPGGRVAFAIWAPAQRNPWATAVRPALIERGLQEPPEPGRARASSRSASTRRCEPLVRAAGFDESASTDVPVDVPLRRLDGVRARRDRALARRSRALLGTLDEADAGVRSTLAARARDRAVPRPRRLRPARRRARRRPRARGSSCPARSRRARRRARRSSFSRSRIGFTSTTSNEPASPDSATSSSARCASR